MYPQIHIETFGDGPRTFVALHGWGGSYRTFVPMLPFLPPDVTLHAIDCPGYGQSDDPEWTRAAYRDAIASALDTVTADRFVLVGNCSGAIFGLDAVIPRHAQRVERIVLYDPFAYTPWYFRLFLIPVFGRIAFLSTFANPVGRAITNRSLRRHRAGSTDMTASFATVRPATAWHSLRILAEIANIDGFAALVRPTRIVFGERTFGAVRRSLEMWSKLWPHAERFELPGVGHLPILEATQRVAELTFGEQV